MALGEKSGRILDPLASITAGDKPDNLKRHARNDLYSVRVRVARLRGSSMTMLKPRTCIICGERAASREHVFPATLGGRRNNKGIYCAKHNGDYSPLAALLAKQLEHFNALLGVVGDHSKAVRFAPGIERGTGLAVRSSLNTSQFAGPRFSSPYVEGKNYDGTISFSTQEEAEAWMAAQRTRGHRVEVIGPASPNRFMMSGIQGAISLGGPEAFRAVGYVGQTFFAQAFPKVARDDRLTAFKAWTLTGIGPDVLAWWEFAPPNDAPVQAFAFGHRIIVGIDRSGVAYGRLSFFGSLHFAMVFGRVDGESRSVVTDINPLARAAPVDLNSVDLDHSVSPVVRPADLSEALIRAVESGRAVEVIGVLIGRIARREQELSAEAIMADLGDLAGLDEGARRARIARVVDRQSQRFWSMVNTTMRDFLASESGAELLARGVRFDRLVEQDIHSPNGLTAVSSAGLRRVCAAMERQIEADLLAGHLDEARVLFLISDGEAYALLFAALVEPILNAAKSPISR